MIVSCMQMQDDPLFLDVKKIVLYLNKRSTAGNGVLCVEVSSFAIDLM